MPASTRLHPRWVILATAAGIGLLIVAVVFMSRQPRISHKPVPYEPATAIHKAVSQEKAFEHVTRLVGFGPHPSGSDALKALIAYCEQSLQSNGWATLREPFTDTTPRGEVRFINLRARFPVRDKVDWEKDTPRILLCSHYDSKIFEKFEFTGANDGCSSTGALLEIARVTAARPDIATQLELVFFDGEEAFNRNITRSDGLYGSRYYSRKWRAAEKKPQYGIVLDLIGDKDLGITLPTTTPKLLSKRLFQAATDLGYRDKFGFHRGEIIDDHIPLNNAGIPSIDIIDLDYTAWHTEGDTLDKVSAESIGIVTKTTLLMIEKYLLPVE